MIVYSDLYVILLPSSSPYNKQVEAITTPNCLKRKEGRKKERKKEIERKKERKKERPTQVETAYSGTDCTFTVLLCILGG
jgi:hypothetical protein